MTESGIKRKKRSRKAVPRLSYSLGEGGRKTWRRTLGMK